jgi:protein gp37
VSYPEYEHSHGYTNFKNVISENWPLPNVWLGVSVEDQKTADERIPLLLQTPAAVRWISAEPLLGEIDLTALDPDGDSEINALTGHTAGEQAEAWGCNISRFHDIPPLNWVVCGGESGPHARPSHPDWFRSLRDQCKAAGVPFFFKQWGEYLPFEEHEENMIRDWKLMDANGTVDIPDGRWPDSELREVGIEKLGKKAAGRLLDGKEHSEYPYG